MYRTFINSLSGKIVKVRIDEAREKYIDVMFGLGLVRVTAGQVGLILSRLGGALIDFW